MRRCDGKDSFGSSLVNEGKFQILHCGVDGVWGDSTSHFWVYGAKPVMKYPGPEHQNFMRLDIDADGTVTPAERSGMIVYPEGPLLDGLADTAVNFGTEVTIEDAKQ
jgi:hypothetical protein